MKKNILFVCIENSNRSQMAEAFATMIGKEKVNAFSAGSRPSGKINPKAIEAMKMLGYDLTIHQSKSLDDVLKAHSFREGLGEAFDTVVTMGCGDKCSFIPAKKREDWNIPDPKNMPLEEFFKVRDLIGEKVMKLIKDIS